MVGLTSLCALITGVVLISVLHVMPPSSEIDPVRRTLSEYALGPHKWIFDAGVVTIAIGSGMTFLGLVRRKVIRPLSGAAVLGGVWTVSLVVVVVFTKTNWSVGPSIGGTIHRYAGLAGFLSLPLATVLAAKPVFPQSAARRWLARGLGITSLLWFGSILVGVANMLAGGGPWWRFVPLGLVERAAALTGVAAMLVITLGLAVRQTPADTPPDPG